MTNPPLALRYDGAFYRDMTHQEASIRDRFGSCAICERPLAYMNHHFRELEGVWCTACGALAHATCLEILAEAWPSWVCPVCVAGDD